MLISIARFGLIWLATSVLVSTIGDAIVGTGLLNLPRDIFFAVLEAPFSTGVYAILLWLFQLGYSIRILKKPVSGWLFPFVFSGVVLAIVEASVICPFAVFAWFGHDGETMQAMGMTRFLVGVIFDTAAGPIGCIAGTAAAWSVQRTKVL